MSCHKAIVVITGGHYLHEHYLQNNHNEICDWEITIIDHVEMVKALRQKELYWYHKLKTYAPFGLNERDVYAVY